MQDSNQLDMPKIGKKTGEGNGYALLYSCLENSMGRGARQDTVHGIAESDMTEQLLNKDMNRSSKDLCRVSWLNE